jgi:hypothetical protein
MVATHADREEGFLVVESEGGLSGRVEFRITREAAEALAKDMVEGKHCQFPVLVVPVTRFTTERIRAIRGPSFT